MLLLLQVGCEAVGVEVAAVRGDEEVDAEEVGCGGRGEGDVDEGEVSNRGWGRWAG